MVTVGVTRVIVAPLDEDLKGRKIGEALGAKVKHLKVYDIDGDLEVNEKVKELFANPVTEVAFVNDAPADGDLIVRVGYKPGVKDNVGDTATEALRKMNGFDGRVYSSEAFVISGTDIWAARKSAEGYANQLIQEALEFIKGYANPLIQNVEFDLRKHWKPTDIKLPKVEIKHEPQVALIDLKVDNKKLEEISRNGNLALSVAEMRTIGQHFRGLGRDPTDAELEMIAQTWSEHCHHKIFNARINYSEPGKEPVVIDSLFKTYIQGATEEIKSQGRGKHLLSVFTDNAGILRFDENHNYSIKVETHNSPSALDPYGGAITGIVGVNRDILGAGMGAKPVANLFWFATGSPSYGEPLPQRGKDEILHPKRIFTGVVKGVEDGGNQSGIPTIYGGATFDRSYLGKPAIYVGTLGIMPAVVDGKPSHEKVAREDDLIVMIGGRVGIDGIHGATASSEGMQASTPSSHVQIGDAFTQKVMFDFMFEARDLGMYSAVTDNGAGGLSSSVGEMAKDTNGAEIDLAKVPLKYQGLDPGQILISESQERMTLAVKPERVSEFLALARKRGVEASVLGKFNSSGRFTAKYGEKTVADLDMEFLHHGDPQLQLEAEWVEPILKEPDGEHTYDLGETLKEMLADENLSSREWIYRQYDHEVQGGSVVKPLVGAGSGPSDAAVIRPVLESEKGVAVTMAVAQQYSKKDTYHMAQIVYDKAIRKQLAVNGDLGEMGTLDNFCWPSPLKDKFVAAQLVRAAQGLSKIVVAYAPLVSGKDSMSMDFKGVDEGGRLIKISAEPTLLVTGSSIVQDTKKAVTSDFKAAGDSIYVLGRTTEEMGCSVYNEKFRGAPGNDIPQVDLERNLGLYLKLQKAMELGLLESAHAVAEGGLAVAIAESAIGGQMGVQLHLPGKLRPEYELFSETPGRFVVSVRPGRTEEFEGVMESSEYANIGAVSKGDSFKVYGGFIRPLVDIKMNKLEEGWNGKLPAMVEG